MSIAALVKGVEARLRSAAVFNDQPAEAVGKYVGVQPAPGKPPRNFGQWYAAVAWGGGRGRDANPQRSDQYHGVVVTLTCRLNYAPKDRQAVRLATAGDIYDLVDRIAGPNVVHGSWEVLALANAFITGTAEWAAAQDPPEEATVNGFVEPLVLDAFGPERPVNGEWVGADSAKDCYAIDIKFREARRVRPYNG